MQKIYIWLIVVEICQNLSDFDDEMDMFIKEFVWYNKLNKLFVEIKRIIANR